MSDALGFGLPALVVYPEKVGERESWAARLVHSLEAQVQARFARARARRLARIAPLAAAHAATLAACDDAELKRRIRLAGAALRRQPFWSLAALAEAFALIREAAARVLGQRPYDVQLIGACAILRGGVAEMATGEGKTLVAALAAATAALAGERVHVVTINEYLATRDEASLRPLYAFLGLETAVIEQAAPAAERAYAYGRDVVYCTNKDLAFDYMRDRLAAGRRVGNLRRKAASLFGAAKSAPPTLLRGLQFAIVDEADSVLVDEARTPLILSGESGATREEALYDRALALARSLSPHADFELIANERRVVLTARGKRAVAAAALSLPGGVPDDAERLAASALTAVHLMHGDEHYLVRDGKVEIIDEYSGRAMPDRSWSEGLHELIERKERLELSPRRGTRARMTYQRFFRRYRRLAGMTGTAAEVAVELHAVYRLPVVAVPPNRPDAKAYDPVRAYVRAHDKWAAIAALVERLQAEGAPVLVGARTVGASALAAAALEKRGLPHEVLSAAQGAYEAQVVAQAGRCGAVTVATNMAGRGTDIRLDADARAAGGLHVILSEPHEAARIDRQLAGRCGRQGDPGRVFRFVSLEDAIVQHHCPRPLVRLAATLARFGVTRPIVALAWFGQKRAEALHGRMRRDLLRHDEWLGDAIAFVGEPE